MAYRRGQARAPVTGVATLCCKTPPRGYDNAQEATPRLAEHGAIQIVAPRSQRRIVGRAARAGARRRARKVSCRNEHGAWLAAHWVE